MEIYLEKKEYKSLIFLYFLLVCINLIVISKVKMPSVIPDEINTLAMPAYFAGYKWNLISDVYYGWGGGVLYFPLFLVIKDSIFLYKSILFVNILVIGTIPIISYIILRRYFLISDKKFSIILSFLIGIYPGNLSSSYYAWNETWVRILPWLVVFLLLELKHNYKKTRNSILLGGICIYAYSIHGRLIIIFPIICILSFLYYLKNKEIFINIKYFLISAILMFIIDKIVKNKVQSMLFGENTVLPNTLSHTLEKLISSFRESHTIINIVRATSSYLFYIIITSFGLMTLAIMFLYYTYIGSQEEKGNVSLNFEIFGTFSVLGIFCSIIISVLFFCSDFEKYKMFIYGRYTDQFTPLIMLYVIARIYEVGLKRNKIILNGIFIFFHFLQIVFTESKGIEKINITDVNVSTLISLTPNYKFESGFIFTMVLLILYIISILCFLLLFKKKKISLLIYIMVYLISVVHLGYIRVQKSDSSYRQLEKEYKIIKKIMTEKERIAIKNLNIIQNNFQQEYLMLFNGMEVLYCKDISYGDGKFLELILYKSQEPILEKGRFQVLSDEQIPLKLYYKDKEVADELRSKGVKSRECELQTLERESFYSNRLQPYFRFSGYLSSGNYMFGPYIKLQKGKYIIVIRGKGFLTEQKSFQVYGKNINDEKSIAIEFIELEASDNELIYSFELEEETYDLETVLHNLDSKSIRIDSVDIRILE